MKLFTALVAALVLAGSALAADVQTGGVRMIPVQTPKGEFRVWTKRVGHNPTVKVLLLHGGPGATHEYFEAFDSFFPNAGIEYYYYDQLGSERSDKPEDPSLVDTARYVEEVEQVRKALGLDNSNFYLLGHSWGGILAIEYALKYQQNLKGLVISNMMASIPAYNKYAHDVLMPKMDQKALARIRQLEAEGKYEAPEYMELLMPSHYEHHILRMPAAQWPEPVTRSFGHLNPKIYVPMQGPSELGASGKLVNWDRVADLGKITVPTLVIGAQHDTMDPAHMKMMAAMLRHGSYLYLPNGSHMAMYDDQQAYFAGLISFLASSDDAAFSKQVNAFVDRWHDDAANTRPDYWDKFAPQGIFIGTDKSEIWTRDQFKAWAKRFWDRKKAWNFTAQKRNVYFSPDKQYVWFDEQLNTQMGTCQASGVLRNTPDGFRIEHYQLSLAVPNPLMDSFTKAIAEHEKKAAP
jgi:proline iminopeptidase